jgi:hypothetical protein
MSGMSTNELSLCGEGDCLFRLECTDYELVYRTRSSSGQPPVPNILRALRALLRQHVQFRLGALQRTEADPLTLRLLQKRSTLFPARFKLRLEEADGSGRQSGPVPGGRAEDLTDRHTLWRAGWLPGHLFYRSADGMYCGGRGWPLRVRELGKLRGRQILPLPAQWRDGELAPRLSAGRGTVTR